MDVLSIITSQLKENLLDAADYKAKESIIFEHIKSAEKLQLQVDDFPSNLDWINTSKPLSSRCLEGKIVVLDFFTYCCINCLHIIPQLRQLEENFSVADGLVVIGVHSAKFENEKDSQSILLALKRYNVTHPVVNDKDCFLWNKLNISCWPTLLILGPQRQPIFCLIGEGNKDELILFVKIALKFYKTLISSHQLPLISCDQIVTSSLLSFPGKITRWKNFFAVSDSGNHRIIIFDDNGFIKFTVGGKTPGFKDGPFNIAQFNSPQGVTFHTSEILYVADCENHAIRMVDLTALKVTTVVGSAQQKMDVDRDVVENFHEISSPWDVCIVPCSDIEDTKTEFTVPAVLDYTKQCLSPHPSAAGDILLPPILDSSTQPSFLTLPPPPPPVPSKQNFQPMVPPSSSAPSLTQSNKNNSDVKVLLIAAAGSHQILGYFMDDTVWWKGKKYNKNSCVVIAGSGKEENRNNRYPLMASFAQPSGLAYSPELKSVFVADSESSSIRKLSLKDGAVSHVAGGGRSPDDLFCYGDVDGKGYKAKLQHPLGVAWNSKSKSLLVCDTYNHKIKEINNTDGTCFAIHKTRNFFNEPSGCCMNDSNDILYVADTNNNCIKVVDLKNGNVKKFDLKQEKKNVSDSSPKNIWEVKTQLSQEGGSVTLKIHFSPREIHGKWKIALDTSRIKVNSMNGNVESSTIEFTFIVLPSKEDDFMELHFDLVLCGSEICAFKKLTLKVLITRIEVAEKNVLIELGKCLM